MYFFAVKPEAMHNVHTSKVGVIVRTDVYADTELLESRSSAAQLNTMSSRDFITSRHPQ
jgi:hypothetical protein